MSIDETDHEPRPADDYYARVPVISNTAPVPHEIRLRLQSLLHGLLRREPFCHQLGVAFAELPHSLP